MIKKIIFDIDKTLLNSYDDSLNAYQKYIKENNMNSSINSKDIYDIFEAFEKSKIKYTKVNAHKFMQDKLGTNFTYEEFEKMLIYYGNEATLINKDTLSVLNYLTSKYELIALSNWFYECQVNRLKKVDISKYFKEIYGVDNLGRKPDVKTFEKACYPYKFSECLIIGDNLKSDIMIPYKLGMNVIYFNEKKVATSYDNISNIKELLDKL